MESEEFFYVHRTNSLTPAFVNQMEFKSEVNSITHPQCFSFCYYFLSTELGSPRDLETRDVTDTSFFATWVPAPGKVRQYRVTWKSLYSDEAGEKTIPGDTAATVLDGLTPETRYRVNVYAVYGRGEGQPLVGEETTDSKLASLPLLCFYFRKNKQFKTLKVSDQFLLTPA